MTDVKRVQLALSDIRALFINYQGVLQNAEDTFRVTTGLAPGLLSPSDVPLDAIPEKVEDVVDLALKKNNSVLMSRGNFSPSLLCAREIYLGQISDYRQTVPFFSTGDS